MTAADVKEKLRRRHPATQTMGYRQIPGPWTCIEEWRGVDLLAFSVHSSPPSGRTCGLSYIRVGYEVKVSRSDYRVELRRPEKRAAARAMCHEFYFAVPRGLLKPEEIAEGSDHLPIERALYVPEDVGLVEVDGRGARVVRKSPVNRAPAAPFRLGGGNEHRLGGGDRELHDFVRWVSARPDPRHDGVVDGARVRSQEIRDLQRVVQCPAPTEETAA